MTIYSEFRTYREIKGVVRCLVLDNTAVSARQKKRHKRKQLQLFNELNGSRTLLYCILQVHLPHYVC
jgi:hypothetical protein